MDDLTARGHAYVLEDVRGTLPALYDVWKQKGSINPFVMIWPRKAVQWLGMKTNQSVGFDMPADRNAWPEFLAEKALKNAAFALLLTERKGNEIVAILETQAGTSSWHLPVEDHGNVEVLGEPIEQTDIDSIGLLWRPTAAEVHLAAAR